MSPRPELLSGYGFELDPFQVRAIEALEDGRSVLVAAPTGSGKTVVAEYAVAKALAEGGKAFYTAPIKALSNQKFTDLARVHGSGRVGLLTGDNAINGDASVVVMTTEVLRNMLYAGAPALDHLRYVVLDEVHYLQDAYRGPVWEEVIIHLAPEVQLVCLSATVSNAEELADWISSVRGPTAAVIEERRPVELQNLYCVGDKHSPDLHLLPTLVRGKPNPEADRLDAEVLHTRGRPVRGRPRRRFFTPRRVEVIERLLDEGMLPAITFIFSRNACDEARDACLDAGLRLTAPEERPRIRAIVDERTAGLADADLDVLGFDRFLAGLEAGIAPHHAGMVPPFKEAVEACFAEGLTKAVFATETLALGVNLPARSVVIERLTKFSGERRALLTPGEYTQLTGRAGRRGIDDVGYAVVLWSPFVPFQQVATLASSRTYALRSAFRPTYNMTANLVRSHGPEQAHHLLNQSFAQFQAGNDSLVRRFDRVLRLLEAWGYLDGWALTDAGHLLARTYHESDLLVAEALTSGLLDGLDAPSLAAVVSCFTYEHRGRDRPPRPQFPSGVVRGRFRDLEHLASELIDAEEEAGLPQTRVPDPGFVHLAHAWAAGGGLADVLEDQLLSGGDFVRNVKQVIDLLRGIADIAPLPATARQARAAADALHRGVVTATSALDVDEADPEVVAVADGAPDADREG